MKKTLLFPILLGLLTSWAQAFELVGFWKNLESPGEKPLQFIKISNAYHFHSQERFVFPDGAVSHTIDQSVKLVQASETTLTGSVDFYDSRGCSFKNFPVTVEFQNADVASVLMTVPRYQYVTTTVYRPDSYERPRYCRYPGGIYICGSEPVVISRRSECRLLETVEIPVTLERAR